MKLHRNLGLALLAAILLVVVISAPSSDESAQLRGTVRDQLGAVIPKAGIFVHWNTPRAGGPKEPTKYDFVVLTDGSGTFSAAVRPGFYDICVHAQAFSPACETVAASAGQITMYSPALKVNELIMGEHSDRFGEEVPSVPSELPRSIPPKN